MYSGTNVPTLTYNTHNNNNSSRSSSIQSQESKSSIVPIPLFALLFETKEDRTITLYPLSKPFWYLFSPSTQAKVAVAATLWSKVSLEDGKVVVRDVCTCG